MKGSPIILESSKAEVASAVPESPAAGVEASPECPWRGLDATNLAVSKSPKAGVATSPESPEAGVGRTNQSIVPAQRATAHSKSPTAGVGARNLSSALVVSDEVEPAQRHKFGPAGQTVLPQSVATASELSQTPASAHSGALLPPATAVMSQDLAPRGDPHQADVPSAFKQIWEYLCR